MSYNYGQSPPPIPYNSRPQMARSLPTQPSFGPSISDLVKKNAVYYPNYKVYDGCTPDSLNYDCIDHVFYAFAALAADGTVYLSDEWADMQMKIDGCNGCLGSLMQLKRRYPHLKLILSIGGAIGSQHFADVAASAATRDTFARTAKGLVDILGFDGIDIDWEHPSNAQQGRDFLSLLAGIRIHLPDEQYILSTALPAGEWALQHVDLYKAQDYLDLLNLMAYDFFGPWSEKSGHHAQLYPRGPDEPSASAAVEYVLGTGFPAKKVLLGIPSYGRSFLGSTGPGQAYSGHAGNEGTFEYQQLPRDGAEEIINTSVVGAFCTGGDGGWISYDNPETVRMKAQYCKEKGLGGLFYWHGAGDVEAGSRSLISAGYNALHN